MRVLLRPIAINSSQFELFSVPSEPRSALVTSEGVFWHVSAWAPGTSRVAAYSGPTARSLSSGGSPIYYGVDLVGGVLAHDKSSDEVPLRRSGALSLTAYSAAYRCVLFSAALTE